jgi:MFS family permease
MRIADAILSDRYNRTMTVHARSSEPESTYAWLRLCASLALMTISGVGMYVSSVALPLIQAEFGLSRSDASLPYTVAMVGFGTGSILMGRISDRFGVMGATLLGGLCLGIGFIIAGLSQSYGLFLAVLGVLIGLLGTSAGFAPLVADTSMWFDRRRGIAVAICASGNYLAGAIWPPVLQHFFDAVGWRTTFIGVGIFCTLTILPLAFMLRRPPPRLDSGTGGAASAGQKTLDLSPNMATVLLCVAAVGCCIAMSMPQVHIVAYCSDLGYGAVRGAQMMSIMLGAGVISRLVSGWICDRIGGLRTLLLGSILQGLALLLYLPFDSLVSLFVVSALFGLFQGGLVPSYTIIVREYFSPRQAGFRVGLLIMCNQVGMALGGWMSGFVFDLTGSYRAAFLNGSAWNMVNLGIAIFLLYRSMRPALPAVAARGFSQ